MGSSDTDPTTDRSRPSPARVDSTDRLRSIYRHDGPFVSVYLATRPTGRDAEPDLGARWAALRTDLERRGAPLAALEAVDARVALPAPEDTAAIGVLASADGSTVVEYGQEPPRGDVGHLDSLPYVAPVIEWHQRRVPHLVVTVGSGGVDVVSFGDEHLVDLESIDDEPLAAADRIVDAATRISAALVVVAGDRENAAALADRIRPQLPVECRVVTDTSSATVDELADSAVRHTIDTAARRTVALLREHRFLAAHGDAVDGVSDTIAALAAGLADLVLIHDDPADGRRAFFGEAPADLSVEPGPGRVEGRLVDVVIRSAVLSGVAVHIIPSTGPQGPDDDTAALTRAGPGATR